MRLESRYGACYELWWDSRGRMRMWQGYSRTSQRMYDGDCIIVSSFENLFNAEGHYLGFNFRYADDPEYYSDEYDETSVIDRVFINGEEVMIS